MHVLIACPTGKGAIHHETLISIYAIERFLLEGGHSCDLFLPVSTKLVAVRNCIATRLMESGADLLVGIDDDVAASLDAFRAMLSVDVDYIGGCIPQRALDLDRYADGVLRGFSNKDAMRFAAPLASGPYAQPGVSVVKYIPAGFFLLRPEPLRKIVDSGAVSRRAEATPHGETEAYGFYDFLTGRTSGKRLSEDFSFCRRLRDAGYDVHAYKGAGLSHSGDMAFWS